MKLVKQAIDSTIALIKAGSAPTDALEKVARQLNLNPNFIQRTGEATNVALHLNHFKTAEDRSSDFPIADTVKVTKAIYGEEPVEKSASWFPSVTPQINYNKRLSDKKFIKQAGEIASSAPAPVVTKHQIKEQLMKSANYISRLKKELEAIQVEKKGNDIYLEGMFNAVVNDFKKSAAAREPFHAFETAAYANFGDAAVPYIDLVYKTAGLKEDRGTHDKFKFASDTNSPQLNKFAALMKLIAKSKELAVELKEASEYVETVDQCYKEACYKLAPEYSGVTKSACNELINDIQDLLVKEAGPMSKSVVEHFLSKYNNTGESKKPVFSNSSNDNNERVTMLQELIMTDPILAHQDPRKILSAYQQILRLAPQMAKEKEVVRSLLRQLTATQSLAPVEANQLVEANTNLLKQHQLFHSQSGGDDKKRS